MAPFLQTTIELGSIIKTPVTQYFTQRVSKHVLTFELLRGVDNPHVSGNTGKPTCSNDIDTSLSSFAAVQ